MQSVEMLSHRLKQNNLSVVIEDVLVPIASKWPDTWLNDFPVLRAFATKDEETIGSLLKASDDDELHKICHTRHPTLGFFATRADQVANHAFWAAQIVVALDAWKRCRPFLWSRQISEDGMRIHRPLLYGPLNHVRKLKGRLETPLGELDPRLHPSTFGEACLSIRSQWNGEWPNSHRISGALSFFAIGHRGPRRIRHYEEATGLQAMQTENRTPQTSDDGNLDSGLEGFERSSKIKINTGFFEVREVVECHSDEQCEHDVRDGTSVAVLRTRHRALRLDRNCLRATLNQLAPDTMARLVHLLNCADQNRCNPRSVMLAGLALFTGRPIAEVAKFSVLSSKVFQTGLIEKDRWSVRFVLPHSKSEDNVAYIDHELPAVMQRSLNNIVVRPGDTLATTAAAEDAQDEIAAYLSPYDRDVKLTHRAIAGEVRALAGAGNGGLEAILGLDGGHDTQAHYTVIELERARKVYREACARLLPLHLEEAFLPDKLVDENRVLRVRLSGQVISRSPVPGSKQLRDFFDGEFSKFRDLLDGSTNPGGKVDRMVFNGAVSFIVFLQSLLTANRPTHGVYVPHNSIDARTGLIARGDKTDAAGYERRLLYFPQELLNVMKLFESSADAWCHDHDLIPSETPSLINDEGDAIELSARSIEAQWGTRFPFQANTPRRLHFAWLCKRGTPNMFRNMAMGHWTGGNEPWGQCSSMHFGEYTNWRRRTVAEILPELGLPKLSDVAQMCSSSSVQPSINSDTFDSGSNNMLGSKEYLRGPAPSAIGLSDAS